MRVFAASFLLAVVGCFDGSAALGLPCRSDDQCGNGQRCIDDVCGGPQGSSGSGSATGSGSGSGSGTATGTGGGNPDLPGCDEGLEPISDGSPVPRSITVTDSGNPMSVVVGRFSEALDPAVAVLSRTPARVTVFTFDGGEFVRELGFDVVDEPMDLAVGDLDLDGFDDLAVVTANRSLDDLTVYWGDAADPLRDQEATSVDASLDAAFSVAIGELVGVGEPGAIVSTGSQGRAAGLFVADGRTLSFAGAFSGVSDSPWDTLVAELDGQAPPEVIIAGANDAGLDQIAGGDQLHILSAEDGVLSNVQTVDPQFLTPFGVSAGDLDGDGLPELVAVGKDVDRQTATPEESDNAGQIGLCSRTSTGEGFTCSSWAPDPDKKGFNNVRLADLNCDGILDVVVGTTGGTEPTDGAVFFAAGPLTEGFGLLPLGGTEGVGNRMAIADMTGDGRPDVVVPVYGPEGSGTSTVRVFSLEEGGE